MSVDIDFSSLSIKDALDLAILVEDEAEERYRELADNLELHNTLEAAKFFRFMVTCEAKHGDELRAKRKELFGDQPTSVDRSMLWEVEAPGYDPEVRELFTELRQEEVEHMQMVREQMKKAPDADGFDPDDFADEGVAQ